MRLERDDGRGRDRETSEADFGDPGRSSVCARDGMARESQPAHARYNVFVEFTAAKLWTSRGMKTQMMLLPALRSTLRPPIVAARSVAPIASLFPDAVADDSWSVFAILAASAIVGRGLGTTAVGRALSAPVCAMVVTFVLTAAHVLPEATKAVTGAQGLAVQLATPLLLLNADLRAVGQRATRMVPAFLLGTVGTCAGTVAGVALLQAPLTAVLGADALIAACALMAKNIGGGLNFVAVAAALRMSPLAFATALAVDNVMALVYFPLVAWLGRGLPDLPAADAVVCDATAEGDAETSPLATGTLEARTDDGRQGAALAVGLVATAASRVLAAHSLQGFELPIASVLTVAAATLAPQWLGPLAPSASELGSTGLFIFFASAGWTGGSLGSAALLGAGPVLLGFLTILYAVHLAIILGLSALARQALPSMPFIQRCAHLQLALVGSNANIGGPATASALASGNGWPSLVAPALLVGNAGYAIATPLALLMHAALRRLLRGLAFVT